MGDEWECWGGSRVQGGLGQQRWKELTGDGSQPGVIAQSLSQTKAIRDSVILVSVTGKKQKPLRKRIYVGDGD